MYKSIPKGIPALVCLTTDKTVIIGGKRYTILKLVYDLEGKYMPLTNIKV